MNLPRWRRVRLTSFVLTFAGLVAAAYFLGAAENATSAKCPPATTDEAPGCPLGGDWAQTGFMILGMGALSLTIVAAVLAGAAHSKVRKRETSPAFSPWASGPD